MNLVLEGTSSDIHDPGHWDIKHDFNLYIFSAALPQLDVPNSLSPSVIVAHESPMRTGGVEDVKDVLVHIFHPFCFPYIVRRFSQSTRSAVEFTCDGS